MKVAVCLSGHMRSYEKTWKSWDKVVLQQYAPDVFIHTWENEGTRKDPQAPIQIENIIKWFQPRTLQVENYAQASTQWSQLTRTLEEYRDAMGDGWKFCSPPALLSTARKVWLCNELKNEFRHHYLIGYDLVFKARPDLYIYEDCIRYALEARNSPIYFVKSGDTAGIDHAHVESIVPEVVIGQEHVVDHFCNFYPSITAIANEAKRRQKPERILNPHTAPYWWMKEHGYEYKIFPVSAYSILR
jgi:hypothetical protein